MKVFFKSILVLASVGLFISSDIASKCPVQQEIVSYEAKSNAEGGGWPDA